MVAIYVWIKFEFMLTGDCYRKSIHSLTLYCAIVRVWSLPSKLGITQSVLRTVKVPKLMSPFFSLSFSSNEICAVTKWTSSRLITMKCNRFYSLVSRVIYFSFDHFRASRTFRSHWTGINLAVENGCAMCISDMHNFQMHNSSILSAQNKLIEQTERVTELSKRNEMKRCVAENDNCIPLVPNWINGFIKNNLLHNSISISKQFIIRCNYLPLLHFFPPAIAQSIFLHFYRNILCWYLFTLFAFSLFLRFFCCCFVSSYTNAKQNSRV